jgi:hypothetical protein
MSHAIFIFPSVLWRNRQTIDRLVLRHKLRKRHGDFDDQTRKPEASGFEAKPKEPIDLGFEAKPRNTYSVSPCA